MKYVENLEYLDFTPETQGIFFVTVLQIPDFGAESLNFVKISRISG